MKFDKKTNYFVSVMEFEEINKNPFIAGLLSMILGMFGVHRFYMKRKLTGFVFLMLSISSVQFGEAYLASILIIISFIEGIVYIITGISLGKNKYANNNIHENKYVGKLENLIDGEKDKVDIREELNEIEIIEVSDIKPIIIPNKNELNNTYKNNWVKKLDLPYERNVMKVTQVKEETINFHEKLCDFIDGELRNKISSLNREVRRIESKGGIYNNILYTIYCISEGHVTKAYSGGHSYYDPEYSYKILEGHLGQSLKEKVLTKALELEKYVSSPIEETLKYFNLTDNGLTKNWWDAEGELRASKEFTNKELNILNVTPYRSTVVWDIDVTKEQIINLYLCIWQVIWSGLKKDLKWKKKNKKTLEDVIDGKYIYFADYENGNILASLLKVSENTIREVMPNTQILNISNEQDNIKKYLPKEIVDDIGNKLIEYKEDISDEKIKEILKGMIKRNPTDWRLKVEEILMTKDNEKASILIDYKEDENFIKIAKEIIKKAEDESLLLMCLYAIEREEKLSQKNTKLLKDIIHHSNISIYENTLESKEALSLELLNRLVELKNPVRKKIELDMNKVEISKQELNKTVEIVKQYIGDEEEREEPQEDKIKDEMMEGQYAKQLKFKHGEFLNLILNLGSMEIEKGKKIAMDNGVLLNAFISDVNKELYEYIQDQVVIIEDGYIKIDDFYIDMVKELIMGEE